MTIVSKYDVRRWVWRKQRRGEELRNRVNVPPRIRGMKSTKGKHSPFSITSNPRPHKGADQTTQTPLSCRIKTVWKSALAKVVIAQDWEVTSALRTLLSIF